MITLMVMLWACDDTWFGVPRDGSLPQGSGTGEDTVRYHPAGYADPGSHGVAAKLGEEYCAGCHGDDLTGVGDALSCDTCHAQGWREDCTRCHGGGDDQTGAPPRYIGAHDTGDDPRFEAHGAHLGGELGASVLCETCHVVPTSVTDSGHVFIGDRTPGVAEVWLSGLAGESGRWDGLGCNNVYCHGSGQSGETGSVTISANGLGCDDCHAGPQSTSVEWGNQMSGKHFLHLGAGIGCSECHGDVVDAANQIIDASAHVNGVPDLRLPDGMEVVGEQQELPVCSGRCHFNDHPHLPQRLWMR